MLRAFSHKYQRELPEECVDLCKGISFGFGTGHICAALISSVMVMGLYFPMEEVPRFRIEFLDRFCEIHGSLLCPELRAAGDCREIVASAAKILDDILESGACLKIH